MDRMKDYRQLVKELPSNTVVFAFGRFQPPTALHELQVKVVKKLAEEHKSDYVIYASRDHKEELLSEDKKVQYMNLMFPHTNIKTSESTSITEAAKELNKKYKKLVFVTSSDLKEEAEKFLNKKNGTDYHFESIDVIVAGDIDPESNKLCESAKKGDFAKFKTGLPATVREIDSRRLMNDIRQGLGLEMVKEEIKLVKDELREQYFRKEIFNVGDIVEHNGNKLTIVKRGSNHLLLKEQTGNLVSKWIQDVTPTEEKEMNEDLTTKTLRNTDAIKVARMIANMLGIDNAESSSSPNNLVNRALYKIRTKTLNTETLNILNKMLNLARQVGIVYDNNLVPQKLKEGIIQPNATDKVSGDATAVDTYSEKYKKKKFAKGQEITFEQAEKTHELDDKFESEKVEIEEPHRLPGHSLHARDSHHRRRKVAYHLGEATALEKFRKAAAERQKKHDDIEKKRQADAEQGKENMSGAIDRLDKALNKEEVELGEARGNAHKLGDKVQIVKGSEAGETGTVGEIRHGAFKDAPKTYTIDTKGGSIQLKKTHIKRFKESYNESHVEFRIDHRDNMSGDTKSTFSDHEAKVSDQSDKATYVKVPSHKADSFKSAMKSKHGVKVELAEETLNEGKMGQIHADIDAHLGKHLANYKKVGGSEHFGNQTTKTAEHIAKLHKIEPKHAQKFVNDYVEQGLKEEAELDEAKKKEEDKSKIKKNPTIKDDSFQLGNTNSKGFDAFFEEDEKEDENLSDDEIEKMADGLSDDDYFDVYDDNELAVVDDDTGEEIEDEDDKVNESALMEVLSRAERMKARARFARTKSKRERNTRIALKMYSSSTKINQRARRLAIKLLKKRLLRGRDISKISVGEKERLEKIVQKRKPVIDRIAMKLTTRVRQIEKARMSHNKFTKTAPTVAF